MWYTNCGQAAKTLIAELGSRSVASLTRADMSTVAGRWAANAPDTRQKRTQHLRRIITWLALRHGAPDTLINEIPKAPRPHPRATTATKEERAAILAAARPGLRCYILLCSDLAIRGGTAVTIAPRHYDAEAGTITFRTKYNANLTLPVTADLAAMFDAAPGPSHLPYVAQYGNRRHAVQGDSMTDDLRALRRKLGITKQLTAHDLRRTTAVHVYQQTRDLRVVQAVLGHRNLQTTLIYLDHRNTPVDLSILERAKLNTSEKTQ